MGCRAGIHPWGSRSGQPRFEVCGPAKLARDLVRVPADTHEELADAAALGTGVFVNGHGSPSVCYSIALRRPSRWEARS